MPDRGLNAAEVSPTWAENHSMAVPYNTWLEQVLRKHTHTQWQETLEAAGIDKSKLRGANRKSDLFKAFKLGPEGQLQPQE